MTYTIPTALGSVTLPSAHYAQVLALAVNPPAAKVIQSSAQTLTTATDTAVAWNGTEEWDNDTIHNFGGVNTQLLPTTAGKYRLLAQVTWEASATGTRYLKVRQNGGLMVARSPVLTPTSAAWSMQIHWEGYLNGSTDYVEVLATQTTGGNLNTVTGADNTWASIKWEGS